MCQSVNLSWNKAVQNADFVFVATLNATLTLIDVWIQVNFNAKFIE